MLSSILRQRAAAKAQLQTRLRQAAANTPGGLSSLHPHPSSRSSRRKLTPSTTPSGVRLRTTATALLPSSPHTPRASFFTAARRRQEELRRKPWVGPESSTHHGQQRSQHQQQQHHHHQQRRRLGSGRYAKRHGYQETRRFPVSETVTLILGIYFLLSFTPWGWIAHEEILRRLGLFIADIFEPLYDENDVLENYIRGRIRKLRAREEKRLAKLEAQKQYSPVVIEEEKEEKPKKDPLLKVCFLSRW